MENHGNESPKSPSIELLAKLELAVETLLILAPRMAQMCWRYIVTPKRFLADALSSNKHKKLPPYTFLAFTTFAVTFAAFISLSAYESVLDDLANIFGGSADNRGNLHLAELVRAIRDRSLSSLLLSTGGIVVVLAVLAKILSRAIPVPSHARQFEQHLCYVAGAQQVHTVLLLPPVFALGFWAVSSPSWSAAALPTTGLFLCIGWYLLLPAIAVSGAIERLRQPAGNLALRLCRGWIFALLNLVVVCIAVYAIDGVPAILDEWQTDLDPPDLIHFKMRYATATLDSEIKMTLTLALEITEGKPLIIDASAVSLGVKQFFPSQYWHQTLGWVGSSDGSPAIFVIRQGETKWVQLSFPLTSEGNSRTIHDGKFSAILDVGPDRLKIDDVPVTGLENLKSIRQ